jgi:HSP20 family molecular chaperone IbpA
MKTNFWEYFRKENIPYDLVVRVDSFGNAMKEGWEIIRSSTTDEIPEVDGSVVGVLGRYNQGKTHLLQKLTGQRIGTSSDGFSTEGLSFKFFATEDTLKHVVLDTAGLNTPVLLTTEKFEEKSQPFTEQKKLEDFLGDLIVDLSDYVIIVVNDLTWQDQEFIWKVAQKRYRKRHERYAETWIVHNLRNCKDPKLFAQKEKEITSLYNAEMLKQGSETFYYSEKFQTRHLFIMNEEYGAKSNAIVYALLRKWISSIIVKKKTSRDPLELVRQSILTCLTGSMNYLPNLQEVKLHENRILIKLSEEKNNLYAAQTSLFVPNYRIKMDDKNYMIHLFVPYIDKDEIVLEQLDDEITGHWTIAIRGDIPPIEGQSEINQIPFGPFETKFNIPTKYSSHKEPELTSGNGIITISFGIASKIQIGKKK